jgi:hypothetical protein
MSKTKRQKDRDRTRRGSVKPVETMAPAHLRTYESRLPPEVRQQPRRQAMRKAAMTREVAREIPGVIQNPQPVREVKRPEPLDRLGVTAPKPYTPRERIAVPESVVKRHPKVTRNENKVEQPLTVRPTCKPRPTKTSGNGKSRPFVPWCSKK